MNNWLKILKNVSFLTVFGWGIMSLLISLTQSVPFVWWIILLVLSYSIGWVAMQIPKLKGAIDGQAK